MALGVAAKDSNIMANDTYLSRSDSRRTEILSWLRGREEEMAAFLAELVAIPTENPPGKNYRTCAEFLERRIRQLDLDCERFAPADAKIETAMLRSVCWRALEAESDRFISTGTTMWFRHNPRNSSSHFAKSISCLGGAHAT